MASSRFLALPWGWKVGWARLPPSWLQGEGKKGNICGVDHPVKWKTRGELLYKQSPMCMFCSPAHCQCSKTGEIPIYSKERWPPNPAGVTEEMIQKSSCKSNPIKPHTAEMFSVPPRPHCGGEESQGNCQRDYFNLSTRFLGCFSLWDFLRVKGEGG